MVKRNSETAVAVVAIIVIFNPRNPDPLAGPISGQFSKHGIQVFFLCPQTKN